MHIFLTEPPLAFLIPPSIAQHSPPPQNFPIVVSAIGEEVSRILFDVFEHKASKVLYGHVPTGLVKRDLPRNINNQLSLAHQGTEQANAGNNVYFIHQSTGVVLDILKDITTK